MLLTKCNGIEIIKHETDKGWHRKIQCVKTPVFTIPKTKIKILPNKVSFIFESLKTFAYI
jgi:hypothetical protein